MKTYFPALILLFFFACSSPQTETNETAATAPAEKTETQNAAPKVVPGFENVRFGMSSDEVTELLGKPDKVNTVSSANDITMEDWFYGENQKIRLVNGKVNTAVKDLEKERELLKLIREAKQNGDSTELKRLMEEALKNSSLKR